MNVNVHRFVRMLVCIALLLFLVPGTFAGGTADITRAERLMRLEKAADFILSQQDEHGAMIESGYINTDSNMLYALMGLIKAYDVTGKPHYWRAVEKGISWLMRAQTPQGDWYLSYRRIGDGYIPTLTSSYRHFSAIRGVDTTMALFIHVVREAERRTQDQTLRQQMRAAAKRAYHFLIEHNMDAADGLFWSSYQLKQGETARSLADYSLFKIKYSADNAETYIGLVAAAALFPETAAQEHAERLKRNFERFFDRRQGVYAVMLDERGQRSMQPAYARWFANGWAACLMPDTSMFALPLAVMAKEMNERGAFPQKEGTYTLSTLAFLLGEQAYPIRSKQGPSAERYLYAVQTGEGGLVDSREAFSSYVNLAGMFILYLAREIDR